MLWAQCIHVTSSPSFQSLASASALTSAFAVGGRNWPCIFPFFLRIWRCPASGKHQLLLLSKQPAQLLLKYPHSPQISPKLLISTAYLIHTVSKIPLSICYKVQFKGEMKVCFLRLMIPGDLRNPALQLLFPLHWCHVQCFPAPWEQWRSITLKYVQLVVTMVTQRCQMKLPKICSANYFTNTGIN